jgi:DNA-binding NtrC family response regulator
VTGDGQLAFNLDHSARVKISEAVRICEGDTKKAAEELGISRATLYRKLKRFHEEKSDKSKLDLPQRTGPHAESYPERCSA